MKYAIVGMICTTVSNTIYMNEAIYSNAMPYLKIKE